ncbi:tetratricopeptide repeat protein [Polymorphospora sp. NPDC050346]|uniref:tetratricopeptide repeat protein n=1 Tax=Polymorphospora sp. NPDC050346 TaxID=3155780 RepID=UPI0033CC76AB
MTTTSPAAEGHGEPAAAPLLGVGNEVSGVVVGPVVQAGVLHGGVHVHQAVPAAPPRAERTLPADVPGFVGRHDELARLLAAVTEADGTVRTIAIHAVDGMPGIGKTALAVHAAHHLAARFPDGQRFVALRAHAPGQARVEPAMALEILLQADGVPAEQIPTGLDARAGLWRHRMADRKLLLVLDDAADTNHITPLLPAAPGCLVLITSRRKLTTLPATILTLDTLPPDQAAQLFTERVGHRALHEPEAVDRITRLCGYLPLAITLTAARLLTHGSWTVTDIADDLAEARDRLAELASGDLAVAAAFDLSYHDLPPDRRRLFRRLGLHPGPDLDRYAAAALDNTNPDQAKHGLANLLEHNLITEPHHGRYRFHDLIAEYAHTLTTTDTDTEQDTARDRLLDYYLHTATTAAGHLPHHTPPTTPTRPAPEHTPTLTDPDQATDWLNREQPNLVAATTWAATTHHPAAIEIPNALHGHLRTHGPWDLAHNLHHTALTTARHTHNQPAQAHTLNNLAHLQRLTDDYAGSADSARQSLHLFQQIGDRLGQANALDTLARAQRMAGDWKGSADTARQSLHLHQQIGNRLGQANALDTLALAQRRAGDGAGSADSARQSLHLFQQIGDRFGQANALDTLALAQYLAGDGAGSADSARQSLHLHQQIGDRFGQAYALNTLAHAQRMAGDGAGAADTARQALHLYQQIGDRFGQAAALNILARTQYLAGDWAGAADTARQALHLFQQIGDRHGQANALQTLGVAQDATGDPTTAATTLQQSLDLFRDVGDADGEAETLNHIGQLLLATTPDTARRQFTTALDIARRIHTPTHEARALEGIGHCALRQGHRDEGVTCLRDALTIYRRINSPHTARVEAALHHEHD